jgi:hypothetical protein
MWRLRFLVSLILGFSLIFQAEAQVPQGISYQAVARTSDGAELSNESIFIRISIRSSSVDGPIEWQEEHAVTTNEFGLFHLIVGDGSSTGVGAAPVFSSVPWALSNHFLQVELDPGDGIFELMGITQLLSVPYAFVAGKVLDTDDADADPTNELITNFNLQGTELTIEEGGQSHSVDLQSALADGDDVIGNESLTLIQLEGTILNLVESGQPLSVELASLSEDDDWQIGNNTVFNLDDRIGIGTSEPSSSLQVNGSVASTVILHESDIPLNLNDSHHIIICNVSEGSLNAVLPAAATCSGRQYILKKTSLSQAEGSPIINTLTISAQLGETIDGLSTLVLNSFFRQEITVVSDGNQWWIISRSTNE